ncbi:hypothetical protein [Chachezhania sediminis]|uniref:hypothetical protein n=1 Tax=Chachezhania sediminis TaxID=2599291 RepID=UPI001E496624|nr:hypothetical protein [Chachezhania sediminis]
MGMIDDIKRDREAGTPGPWTGHNMVHADGRAMTPDEIGEYVCNSVKMGEPNKFLFVIGKHADGGDCDVCHTGNGPRGAANTARIARVPDMEAALLAAADLADALEARSPFTGFASRGEIIAALGELRRLLDGVQHDGVPG